MAKVEAVQIRPGQLLEWNKRVWRVLKSYHVHVGGRGGAFMQVEMKDIEVGTKTNQRFRTEDKVERAFVDPREMQFLYQDGDSYVFMDKENYEQMTLDSTTARSILSSVRMRSFFLVPDSMSFISTCMNAPPRPPTWT